MDPGVPNLVSNYHGARLGKGSQRFCSLNLSIPISLVYDLRNRNNIDITLQRRQGRHCSAQDISLDEMHLKAVVVPEHLISHVPVVADVEPVEVLRWCAVVDQASRSWPMKQPTSINVSPACTRSRTSEYTGSLHSWGTSQALFPLQGYARMSHASSR